MAITKSAKIEAYFDTPTSALLVLTTCLRSMLRVVACVKAAAA